MYNDCDILGVYRLIAAGHRYKRKYSRFISKRNTFPDPEPASEPIILDNIEGQ